MSHCPSCQDSSVCPGCESESAEFIREQLNVVVRQSCDLIDEKRELQRQLYEAHETMRDILHVVENFSGISSPLYQIRERVRAALACSEQHTEPAQFPQAPPMLHLNTDARAWADHFTECTAVKPSIARDRDTMVTWFANAIMAGVDSK